MMNVTYAVAEEKHALENEKRTSYGIVAYANAEQDGTATIVASVRDITYDKNSLRKLVDDCNRFELSTVHLHDVVEDFLF